MRYSVWGARPWALSAFLAVSVAVVAGPGARGEVEEGDRAGAAVSEDEARAFASDRVGDATRGRLLFSQCSACHALGAKAEHRTGPHLTDILDRPAASAKGYPYSLPLAALGLRGMTWSAEALDIYLRRPSDLIQGTDMPHVGIVSAQDRADLIAFLSHPELGGRPGVSQAEEGAGVSAD